MLVRMWRNGNPYPLLVRMQNGTAGLERRKFVKNLKINSPYNPAILYSWVSIPEK